MYTNGVMHSEMISKFGACVQKFSYAHVCRAFPTRASSIEYLPCISEVVVKPFHGCTHPSIRVFIFGAERR